MGEGFCRSYWRGSRVHSVECRVTGRLLDGEKSSGFWFHSLFQRPGQTTTGRMQMSILIPIPSSIPISIPIPILKDSIDRHFNYPRPPHLPPIPLTPYLGFYVSQERTRIWSSLSRGVVGRVNRCESCVIRDVRMSTKTCPIHS